MPEAIICFLESTDFEDAIRKAVSIGGDSDTLACITGGIAEAYYFDSPLTSRKFVDKVYPMLPDALRRVFLRFCRTVRRYSEVVSVNHYTDEEAYWLRGGNTGTLPGRVTPSRIIDLAPGDVFVFGSNLHGFHEGGAARYAMNHFGAEWGNAEGMQGQSYAIPTMEGIIIMKSAIERFTEFVRENPQLNFYVTPIGCGIAGYTPAEIAPMFVKAAYSENVYLPVSFWHEILKILRS